MRLCGKPNGVAGDCPRRILAGQVNSANEVLLTKDTFGLQSVTFGKRIRLSDRLFFLARRATERLEELLGSSAGLVNAEWDQGQDAHGRGVLTLRLWDWKGSVTAVFAPSELESLSQTQSRLYRLWSELLQIRSQVQLEELTSATLEGGS